MPVIPAFERLKKDHKVKARLGVSLRLSNIARFTPKHQSSMMQSDKCSLLFVYLNAKSLNLSVEPEVTTEARKVERDHGKGERNSRGGI